MNLLIVSQYFYPEQFQINEIAPELVKRGHEVTVLCGIPNYPQGIVFKGYNKPEKRDELINGVRVIRCKQIPRGNNPVQLVLNYISFAKNSCKRVKSLPSDFDVILGYQLSPITSMKAALKYKKLFRTPVIFYTLDIWPVSAESMLKSKKNPIYNWVKKVSKSIYSGADRILVSSKPFIEYLHKVNDIPLDRMAYLPQHAGNGMLDLDLTKVDSKDGHKCIDFMYAGNLGKGQRVDIIIKAANILGPKEDYKIHIVGDGRDRSKLESLVSRYNLKNNVFFYGNQRREDMPDFYKKADALLITLRGNNEVGNTMPAKLQMYMTAGKPIFGAINGAANEVISEAKCGSCVPAGDYKGLAKLMEFYIEHPNNYYESGERARKYFKKHFTLDSYLDGLEVELRKVANK